MYRPGALAEIGNPDHGIHPELIPQMMERAAQIVDEVDGAATDQFNNFDALDGYRRIGEEILHQIRGEIHRACVYVGVGRELGPGHRVVTVQPYSGLKYLGSDLYQ